MIIPRLHKVSKEEKEKQTEILTRKRKTKYEYDERDKDDIDGGNLFPPEIIPPPPTKEEVKTEPVKVVMKEPKPKVVKEPKPKVVTGAKHPSATQRKEKPIKVVKEKPVKVVKEKPIKVVKEKPVKVVKEIELVTPKPMYRGPLCVKSGYKYDATHPSSVEHGRPSSANALSKTDESTNSTCRKEEQPIHPFELQLPRRGGVGMVGVSSPCDGPSGRANVVVEPIEIVKDITPPPPSVVIPPPKKVTFFTQPTEYAERNETTTYNQNSYLMLQAFF
jgi:hypothetical protein